MSAIRSHVYRDDRQKSCIVDVEGTRQEAMVACAKAEAARVLEEPVENLYAASVGTMTVVRRQRFVPYLGAAAAPTAWRLTATIKLHPEIVDQRRGGSPEPDSPGLRLVTEESPEEGP